LTIDIMLFSNKEFLKNINYHINLVLFLPLIRLFKILLAEPTRKKSRYICFNWLKTYKETALKSLKSSCSDLLLLEDDYQYLFWHGT
jgi:hypothetical protein